MERIVLAEDSAFLVCDDIGDIPFGNTVGLGLYYLDTRFLSVLETSINGQRLLRLSSSAEHNYMANIQLTNPTLVLEDGRPVPPQTISVRRDRFIERGALKERIGLFNYNQFPVPITLSITFAADFRDMFDIRGFHREARGQIFDPACGGEPLTPACADDTITLHYLGLDGVRRETNLVFDQTPAERELVTADEFQRRLAEPLEGALYRFGIVEEAPPGARVSFPLVLEPDRPYMLTFYVSPALQGLERHYARATFDVSVRRVKESYDVWGASSTRISADNELFTEMIYRSQVDLRGLSSPCDAGYYPMAGIPWFGTAFGRDAIITAYQTLSLNAGLARGALRYLAANQGKQDNSWRDEEPGKIMHEIRRGEMALRNEVPHTPYYGSVDSTPLYIVLFAETMDWLADDQLYQDLLPHVERALEWIDCCGDLDGDGLIEYRTRSTRGIRNQSWKDSYDAVQFPDGRLAEPPIAAIEVQGYVFDAKMRLARLFRRRGREADAERLTREAQLLRQRVEAAFWLPDEQFYAQALDAEKRPVPVVTSNVGHLLWSGLLDEDHTRLVVQRLMSGDLFSGWGIRTLSSLSPNFNPMSYHNGSIWPHDNSLIAAGLRRCGYDREAAEIITGVYEAGLHFRYYRMPELYCGFSRDDRYRTSPPEYPVSCSPQAWAAGSVIQFLVTLLGARADASKRRLYLRPHLPDWLREVRMGNLAVGAARVDLLIRGSSVEVLGREGQVDVIVE
ncbi:MAG: amylo-alpha-1,6-glucosidase [Chloroflexi bacterium]|nr:amylo-alpha-1,6-glucosidase [Chloroflexota bacterium]